jgi:hypothetical protein
MGCGDFIHQECFDQERERLFIEYSYPLLSWKAQTILRGVDASNFLIVPEQGNVWQGMQATYPIQVPSRVRLLPMTHLLLLCAKTYKHFLLLISPKACCGGQKVGQKVINISRSGRRASC